MSSHPFSYLSLANTELIEQLYGSYLNDPGSVDQSWRYFFEGMQAADNRLAKKEDLKSYVIIEGYRHFGHLKAKTNPFVTQIQIPEQLNFKLSGQELAMIVPTYGVTAQKEMALGQLIEHLETIYCGPLAAQYRHCNPEIVQWIQQEMEGGGWKVSKEQKLRIFHYLNQAGHMEHYLHTKYVGQKRFSLEGGETIIPMLAELVEIGAENGVQEIVIGMPHRGRITILATILRKSYSMIFSEFEGAYDPDGGDGDVKYHKGYSSTYLTDGGRSIHVSLTANPSHLESVAPVVQGRVYAKQLKQDDIKKEKVLPVSLHGDASLPGQGVVYETLQLGQLPGYSTGGTLHFVIDNQVGFTTTANEYRSTLYSTDIACTFGAPVFHLNGEDPESCIRAVKMAIEIRQRFHCDVFLNLICYRKYGHNETDEPAFTQPKLYGEIRNRPSIRELYKTHLLGQGVIEQAIVDHHEKTLIDKLDQAHFETKTNQKGAQVSIFEGDWKGYQKVSKEEIFLPVDTAVPEDVLRDVAERFSTIPQGFTIHPKLGRLVADRLTRLDHQIDWALAEHLAFASLVKEGFPIRLSGQDCGRGTFTQRHAVWVDQQTGEPYIPLQSIDRPQGRFDVYNSPLSEFAVLAFEFGYSLASPESLVMWEAQFGDFANGAQVLIDQYLVASEQKWQRYSGLVLLLPHGYEGQGAEHSSARLERYLQLCAQNNIQVCYPTTPAQYFHLLRRQIYRAIRIPLIVMTPKGLLRHPGCISQLTDLTQGGFHEIIIEEMPIATKVICCSGRIYYDLVEERKKRGVNDVAFVRFEQLYPLTQETLTKMIESYKKAKVIYWAQEEPANMGAGRIMVPLLQASWNGPIHFISRAASAAAATGSHIMHMKEYEALMDRIFKDDHAN